MFLSATEPAIPTWELLSDRPLNTRSAILDHEPAGHHQDDEWPEAHDWRSMCSHTADIEPTINASCSSQRIRPDGDPEHARRIRPPSCLACLPSPGSPLCAWEVPPDSDRRSGTGGTTLAGDETDMMAWMALDRAEKLTEEAGASQAPPGAS
uniref:Uncharacterized protein n=3 Tax=Cryptomonas paramaecium TaxID=2898 RepID=A0A7S4PQB5_9CRYP|mmetsp:Transcript_1005/g.2541  ORF Transcript_1005/g.2541 Transcript_1005/m.2541 type:complete len:152 (+) Transcript_1005:319-774(+)